LGGVASRTKCAIRITVYGEKYERYRQKEGMAEDFFYFSNLNFDVAIKASPIMPIVILADNGRIPKNIKIAPVKAKIIPAIN
jgi:hypothetical protein